MENRRAHSSLHLKSLSSVSGVWSVFSRHYLVIDSKARGTGFQPEESGPPPRQQDILWATAWPWQDFAFQKTSFPVLPALIVSLLLAPLSFPPFPLVSFLKSFHILKWTPPHAAHALHSPTPSWRRVRWVFDPGPVWSRVLSGDSLSVTFCANRHAFQFPQAAHGMGSWAELWGLWPRWLSWALWLPTHFGEWWKDGRKHLDALGLHNWHCSSRNRKNRWRRILEENAGNSETIKLKSIPGNS